MEKEENLKGREKVSKMIRKCENIKENKENALKSSNGITLIALVVTIVVLLILAGITINFIMNGNSVFNQALDARVQNKLGEIQDQARLIYSDLLIKNFNGDVDKISLSDIVTELRKQGYEIETREVSANAVTAISASPSTLVLDKNTEGKITIKYDGSDDGNLYYAVVEGNYYKINMNEQTLEIERTASDPEGTAVTTTLEVVTGYDTTIVTNVAINENEITITAGSTEGNTTITIKYGDKTTTLDVKVAPKVTKITLNKETADMIIGKELQLTSTVEPEYALNKEVTWSSSDETIATVDQNGKVTGVAVGTATITVTAKDGSGTTAECSVNVIEPESDWAKIAEISKAIQEGNAKDKDGNTVTASSNSGEAIVGDTTITVGDTFKVYYGEEGAKKTLTVRVLGFMHDHLTDSDGYGENDPRAGISFEFVDCLGTHRMNGSTDDDSTNSGGWEATEMKKYLDGEDGIEKLSEVCRTNIKEVKKQYIKVYNDASSNNNYSTDKLWLLAASEIFEAGYQTGAHAYAITTEGNQYKYYADLNPTYNSANPSLVRNVNGSARTWWLRSPYYNDGAYFCFVDENGFGFYSFYSFDIYGVAPGFCI